MSITAQEVNELRKQTGAGMMDCKKALTEAEGNFEKAIEILRKKGQKISAARADRDATEGGIFAALSDDRKTGVLIELNCETDFVARNEDFVQLGATIAAAVLASSAQSLEEVAGLQIDGQSVKELLTNKMGVIGEKLDVRRIARAGAEVVCSYIHPGARVGVLVAFTGTDGVAEIESVGKDVSMQIAAMNPLALNKEGVDPTVVQKEIEIGMDMARQEGKPEAMLEKIAQGKLQKFYKERTLLEQEFVKDPSITISQYLKSKGAQLQVVAFQRISLGQ